jgi:hypothetical protein
MTDLIAQIEDPRLRERLRQEWAAATKENEFGLVFDPHWPELLPLPGVRPRRGDDRTRQSTVNLHDEIDFSRPAGG